MSHEILKEYDTSTTFKNYSEVSSRNELPPPLIVDAPRLEDSLDDRRRCLLTAAVVF